MVTGRMNIVTDFAVYMNGAVFAHLFVLHTLLIARIYYFQYHLPASIPSNFKPYWREKRMVNHYAVFKHIQAYLIYCFFTFLFVIWYYYFKGSYWYISHFYLIHYHLFNISYMITTFIHYKELNLTPEHVYGGIFWYGKHMFITCWVTYACVNGCDWEWVWYGWMEEDLYRFNEMIPGTINWRWNPVSEEFETIYKYQERLETYTHLKKGNGLIGTEYEYIYQEEEPETESIFEFLRREDWGDDD
jgi:hypothetical protein